MKKNKSNNARDAIGKNYGTIVDTTSNDEYDLYLMLRTKNSDQDHIRQQYMKMDKSDIVEYLINQTQLNSKNNKKIGLHLSDASIEMLLNELIVRSISGEAFIDSLTVFDHAEEQWYNLVHRNVNGEKVYFFSEKEVFEEDKKEDSSIGNNFKFAATPKEVGAALANARKSAGMTQADVAKAMGSHPKFVGRVERGATNATLETIEGYAGAVGLTVHMSFAPRGT